MKISIKTLTILLLTSVSFVSAQTTGPSIWDEDMDGNNVALPQPEVGMPVEDGSVIIGSATGPSIWDEDMGGGNVALPPGDEEDVGAVGATTTAAATSAATTSTSSTSTTTAQTTEATTTTTRITSPIESDVQESDDNSRNMAAVAGGVAGGLVLGGASLIVLLLAVHYSLRKKDVSDDGKPSVEKESAILDITDESTRHEDDFDLELGYITEAKPVLADSSRIMTTVAEE